MTSRLTLRLLAAVLTCTTLRAQFVNFEGHQTRPICLSPDGSRLFAVNTPDARLSVFDVSNPANPAPVLIREIPVGIEPVSVNAVSNDEAWVVNEVSDSVSVVSVASGTVTDTLQCKDEPADVIFAAGRAWVTCSRNNTLRAFDLASHAEVANIALQGLNPRSLAVSLDGTKVYAAFVLSGNRTTLLPANLAPAQPPPTNIPNAPPQVSLIVSADDARLAPKPNLPDNDVAEVDAASGTVLRYFKSTGTVNFAVAVQPLSGDLWVANTEARNIVRFEPNQKGHSVDHRVTKVVPTAVPTITPFDLNPGIDYTLFPNNAAKLTALAQPTAIAFESNGLAFWIAAFGSDRVAKVDAATGAVLARIETGPTTGAAADPAHKRGTRGLALQSATGRLYALNRISNTITIINTTTQLFLTEVATGSFDPTPAVVRNGRGFLYDARLSGNGTQSCAVCHIDGDRDELAWDLGDPAGSMQTVMGANPLGGTLSFQMHPMKGPMTTQTLRGIGGTDPLHWRGDRADFTAFNGAFASLLGGAQLSAGDMNAYRVFINTIALEPNPNQNLDRSMPASVVLADGNTGNPNTGRTTYINDQYQIGLRCNTCHALPTGTASFIIAGAALQESQDFKVPQLRNVYQKKYFYRSATTVSLSGFGLIHDGNDPDLFTFLSRTVFGTFANDTARKRNLSAFVLCFDTGTAPATGYGRSVRTANLAASATDWTTLEAQASAQNIDFVLRGIFNGKRHGFRYRTTTNDYVSDQTGLGPFTRGDLQNAIAAGNATLALIGVPFGSGARFAIDRDGNGIADSDETLPALALTLPAGTPQLAWSSVKPALVLEFSDTLSPPNWQPITAPRTTGGGSVLVPDAGTSAQRFYRLREP